MAQAWWPPAARRVWGLEEREPPFEGSALVELDYGLGEPGVASPAGAEADPHNRPIGSELGQRQFATFLTTGVDEHTCDGVCDPD